MTTITHKQQSAISDYFKDRHIPVGLGSQDTACSIAGINLALSGRLTDEIPDCMSEVIGRWIIVVQDAMPDAMRNSPRWKRLLPLAAGTGRQHEVDRLAIIMDWMWLDMLPSLQPIAEKFGFGPEWAAMCTNRTEAACAAAAYAAAAADASYGAFYAAWEAFDPCGLLEKLVRVGATP